MSISVGDQLPEAEVFVLGNEGPEGRSVADLFKGKRCVLFAVPGAFTPSCHNDHLPGYVQAAADIKGKGVDEIYCLAVNDAFVMKAWDDARQAGPAVTLLADGNAAFSKAVDMTFDGAGVGLGVRSLRYSMLVEDGVVKALHVEESPGTVDVSGAAKMLEAL